jgi:hypothetical protein
VIQPDLRPLGVGEILDRAVTLFVRRFAVLLLILAVVAIPTAILQYAAQPSTTELIVDFQRLLSLPPGHSQERDAIMRQIAATNHVGALGGALIVLSAILSTLSLTACMIAVAQAYAGRLPSVRDVYREALRRWLPVLAALIAFAGVGFVLLFIGALIIVFVAFSIGALAVVSRVGALAIGIPLGIVFTLALFGALVMLYLAAQMTIVSIALEEPNPVRGIAQGFRRTFSRALFWRSMLVGTIVFAVSLIGSLVLLSLATLLSALTHLTALYPIVAVIGSVALNALLITFLVIYAIDVRVRREGYDIMLAVREGPRAAL